MDTLPNIGPSYSSAGTAKARVLKNNFGYGSTQRAGDGINEIALTWNLVWQDHDIADTNTLYAFFKSHKGYIAFYYQPPGETVPLKWTCETYSLEPLNPITHKLTATLDQVFDL
jgi:phage-related protein